MSSIVIGRLGRFDDQRRPQMINTTATIAINTAIQTMFFPSPTVKSPLRKDDVTSPDLLDALEFAPDVKEGELPIIEAPAASSAMPYLFLKMMMTASIPTPIKTGISHAGVLSFPDETAG